MYVGIDLGGINIAVGLVDENFHIVQKGSVPTGRTRAFCDIMQDAAELIFDLLEKSGLSKNDITSIGMGSPGVPDVKKKTVVHASTFPKIHHSSFKDEMAKYFPGVPVYVENDANAAAFGEVLCGAARDVSDAVMVTLGTGVGGGVVIGKKIYAGFNHCASELGHMVLNFNGPHCECGRDGCFEMYASATALIRQTKETILNYPDSCIHRMIEGDEANITGKTAFDAAKTFDAAGIKIVNDYITYLGIGLTSVVNIFQPEKIVLGGGISKEGEYLLKPLRDYLDRHIYTLEVPKTRLVAAELGNDAGIVGAAMLWKNEQ